MELRKYQEALRQAGVIFSTGLSDVEFLDIEMRYGFRFPPDLREFLALGLPISQGWTDWREGSNSEIEKSFNWPLEGICFDIEKNNYWNGSWGPRPQTLQGCFEGAKNVVASAPKLIPICGHRYIPDFPHESGNPVFSVYQTDIIYYGGDLEDFFQHEFPAAFGYVIHNIHLPMKRIPFWAEMAEQNWI